MSTDTGRHRFPVWIALGVILVAAMVVGSGVLSTRPPTPAQRAVAIETQIKCPQCEDLSAADSSAQTAVYVRNTVRQLIAQGRSDQQIRAYLVSRYGQEIELVPPARGWSLLVWALPLGGGAVAIALLALVLIRQRRSAFTDPVEAVRAEAEADSAAGPDRLDARRRFLEQSLADAFAEHRAGDLSDADYQALRRRDTARLAALDLRMTQVAGSPSESSRSGRSVAAAPVPAGTPTTTPGSLTNSGVHTAEPAASVSSATSAASVPTAASTRPKRSRRQRFFLSGAITAFAAATVLFVSLYASQRLPGETSSGNVTLGRQAQTQQTLAQAAVLENEGHGAEAAHLYQQVLRQQPKNEAAMAQLGWLEYQAGVAGRSASLIAAGTAALDQAVRLSPNDYAARLYLGTVLLDHDNDPSGAVTQYRAFLAAHPPPTLLAQAASVVRQAYGLAGVPVPPGVPAD